MTDELTKTFFDMFGIEPSTKYDYCWKSEENKDKLYPPITDSILLGLICIANQYEDYPISTNIKNIQARTLRILLRAKKYLKDTYSHKGYHNGLVRKVRTLFKEG